MRTITPPDVNQLIVTDRKCAQLQQIHLNTHTGDKTVIMH